MFNQNEKENNNNNMKNFINKILFTSVASLLITFSAYGQVTTSQTTLSAAITSGSKSFNLASTSGVSSTTLGAFNTVLFVDQELIGVNSVSGNTVSVQRGLMGTRESSHVSGALVWVGPPNYFSLQPFDPTGSCTANQQSNLPIPFVFSGNIYTCPTVGPRSGQWDLWYPNNQALLPADSTLNGTVASQVCHATYNFAVDGGAVATITPAKNCTIPANAVIYNVSINSTTAVTSAGAATVAVGINGGGGTTTTLVGATAKASYSANAFVQGTPVPQTASTWVKLATTSGTVTATVATAALTAGVIEVYVFYFVSSS